MQPTLDNPSASWLLGTVGFVCPDWANNFYPAEIRHATRLEYYSEQFNAVELDTTFYGAPRLNAVKQWARITPPHFRFCLKMPREVTHGNPNDTSADRFGNASTLETMHRFFDVVENLGDKLAVVLLQFPDTFTADCFSALLRFLDHLPKSPRLAIEFRHESWWSSEIAAELRGRRIGWVATDQAPKYAATAAPREKRFPGYRPRPILCRADFLYVRWLGVHRQFLGNHRQEHFDPTPRLQWWANRLRDVLNSHPDVRTIYGFFDCDFSGHAPTTANRFAQVIGLPRRPRPIALSEPTLFNFV
jgi:uncharacterized protein YecE (DUF72 family)